MNAAQLLSEHWNYKQDPSNFIVLEDNSLVHLSSSTLAVDERFLLSEQNKIKPLSNSEFENLISSEDMILLTRLHDDVMCNSESRAISLSITPALSKQQRAEFHLYMKMVFPNLESSTAIALSNDEKTCISIYPKKAKYVADDSQKVMDGSQTTTTGKKRKKPVVQRWDRSNPDYIHFTAIKRYMTTAELVVDLAKASGLQPHRFEFSGTKDKRAVTMQRLSVYRPLEFPFLSNYSSRSVIIRDIQPSMKSIKLGDLTGNLFVVTLEPGFEKQGRDHRSESDRGNQALNHRMLHLRQQKRIVETIKELSQCAFVNYFGQQRFGYPVMTNPEVGKCLIQGDYARAVLLLVLNPHPDEERLTGLNLSMLVSWLQNWQSNHSSHNLAGIWEQHCSTITNAIAATEGSDSRLPGGNSTVAEAHEVEGAVNVGLDLKPLDGMLNEISDQRPQQNNRYWKLVTRMIAIRALLAGDSESLLAAVHVFELVQQLLLTACAKEIGKLKQTSSQGSQECEEDVVGHSFSLSDLPFKKIFSNLPTNIKQLFVNSYQSLVWNDVARQRMEIADRLDDRPVSKGVSAAIKLAGTARAGDLVLVDVDKLPINAWDVAARNITMNARYIPDWKTAHDAPLRELAVGMVSSSSSSPTAGRAYFHIVTVADEEARQFPIASVVLPLPGYATYSTPAVLSRLAEDDMLDLVDAARRPNQPPPVGTYSDLNNSFTASISADILATITSENGPENNENTSIMGPTSPNKGVDKSFWVPGAYRHILSSARNLRVQALIPPCNDAVSVDVSGSSEVMKAVESSNVLNRSEATWVRLHTLSSANEPTSGSSSNSSSSSSSGNSDSIDDDSQYPFCARVEQLWSTGALPLLLHDIYDARAGSSLPPCLASTTRYNNIDRSPATDSAVEVHEPVTLATHMEASTEVPLELKSIESRSTGGGCIDATTQESQGTQPPVPTGPPPAVRVSFSLCASTYATTYLDWLLSEADKIAPS